jgi:hypothetical protein
VKRSALPLLSTRPRWAVPLPAGRSRLLVRSRLHAVLLSALADNIVFLRYVEYDAELHRLIGVLKKRMSGFEQKPCGR